MVSTAWPYWFSLVPANYRPIVTYRPEQGNQLCTIEIRVKHGWYQLQTSFLPSALWERQKRWEFPPPNGSHEQSYWISVGRHAVYTVTGTVNVASREFSDSVIRAFQGGAAITDLATPGGHCLWCKQIGVTLPATACGYCLALGKQHTSIGTATIIANQPNEKYFSEQNIYKMRYFNILTEVHTNSS